MQIIDAQVHIWAKDTPERPWPKRNEPHRPDPMGKDELLVEMDAAGVDRVIIVPPKWEGERNDLALAAARAHPERFAVMGRLDPDAADARAQLAAWRAAGMLGLRFSFTASFTLPLLTEGRMNWVWAEAERLGLPVYIMVLHPAMHLIDEVAGRHPGLRIVLDHLSLTTGLKGAEAFREFHKVLDMARHPNVAVKASALPCYASDSYPYKSLHPYLRQAHQAFGPKRMFWGSDMTRLPCSYRQSVTMFTEEMPWLSGEDLAWIMGKGVCAWIGWNV